ncbi:site-specific DNA-methyltransferase [Halorussus limi]|uniref:site-specific DNA-methyltransferase (cytosine-N(4)-specific) n=1 Tax=Halorussus limi TaxID=2938695 RepID=A0A8U0HW52_9EURY|nr:site-specific DNA-methyltransferase [Halorussus limi]UPV75310.1 site-specific DNA-methyltransferase [Halorussus limi]
MSSNDSLVSDDRYGVYQADSRKLAKTLADYFDDDEISSLVDATVTSPPYADIKDYGYDEQIGSGDSYDQYLDDLRKVFKNVYEVTAEDGSLWLNINNRQFNGRIVDIKSHIIEALENLENKRHCEKCGDRARRNGETGELYCTNIEDHEDGDEWRYDPTDDSWICHNEVIWDKQKSNDERDGVRNVFEYVLIFKKSEEFEVNEDARIYDPTQLKQWWISDTYNYSPDGATYPNVWDIPAEMTGGWGDDDLNHDAVFPAALVERMIEMSTKPGDTVLDPFAGTGTTLAVGDLMDRRTIGFELNPDYISLHGSRHESIEQAWFGGESEHLSLEDRKQRYAQATWALRHHGYVNWLFTTLRSQARDVKDIHDLWSALAEADTESVVERWCSNNKTTNADPLIAALRSTLPIKVLLENLDISCEDVISGSESQLDSLIDAASSSPAAIVAALLETLDEPNVIQGLGQGTSINTEADIASGEFEAIAEELLDELSPVELFTRLSERVTASTLTECVSDLDTPTQATLGEWGTAKETDGPDRDAVLFGALIVAIRQSITLETETRPSVIEPLIDLQRTHGDRFGIHTVVLQPKTEDGMPPEDEDRAPVKQSFLFASQEAASDGADVLEAAVKYLHAETPSSNAKKLRKHGLDAEREWLSVTSFDECIENDELAWPTDAFYLYTEGRPEQYTRQFDFNSQLWEMCTSNPSRWSEKYCTRTRPTVINPLRLIIEEAEPDQPRYTIRRINNYGNATIDSDDEGYSTSFF